MTPQQLIDGITDQNREQLRFFLKSHLDRLNQQQETRAALMSALDQITQDIIPLDGMNVVIEQDKLNLATTVEQLLRDYRVTESAAHASLGDAIVAASAFKGSCVVALACIQAEPPAPTPSPIPIPTP